MASDVQDACRKEKTQRPDDVWVDDEWKAGKRNALADAIGFNVDRPVEED
jgi:hypothetical protein